MASKFNRPEFNPQDKYFTFKNKAHSLGMLFRWLYTEPKEILDMLESVTLPDTTKCMPENKHVILWLKRCMFLIKVYKVVAERKNSESGLLPCLMFNLKYHLEKLQWVASAESKVLLEEVLTFINLYGDVNIESHIESALHTILKDNYTMAAFGAPPRKLSEYKYVEWFNDSLIPVIRDRTRHDLCAVFPDYRQCVPSITSLTITSKKLLDRRDMSDEFYGHKSFNYHYNQVVFWTTALKMYHGALWKNLLEVHMDYIRDLIKRELEAFMDWVSRNEDESCPLHSICDYMTALMETLEFQGHNEMLATQLFTFVCESEYYYTTTKYLMYE
ncbi:transcriptional control protein [Bovine gammaherpesvirus 6]|uniref:Transcriptional control protein n=1 Tax=Bovine gammaherpesvirus 6 TaxID=1504288 RepID=A0A060CU28_9GAMA|nr:transcriptional control protein [Bovine gammaherpesvirus 6]AIB03202.1 transcriptional control protein [Bovine gammaherpesvirus 6]